MWFLVAAPIMLAWYFVVLALEIALMAAGAALWLLGTAITFVEAEVREVLGLDDPRAKW